MAPAAASPRRSSFTSTPDFRCGMTPRAAAASSMLWPGRTGTREIQVAGNWWQGAGPKALISLATCHLKPTTFFSGEEHVCHTYAYRYRSWRNTDLRFRDSAGLGELSKWRRYCRLDAAHS